MQRCTRSQSCRLFGVVRLVLVSTLIASAPVAWAQSEAITNEEISKQIEAQLGKLPTLIKTRWAGEQSQPGASLEKSISVTLDPRQRIVLYSLILATGYSPKAVDSFKTEVDEARLDKQIGSGAASSGSTSLTSKGSVPAILGFAVENGALERSVSGSTITFRGRPVQIVQALQKTSFNDGYRQIESNGSLGLLNRFSFALSFDTNRGNAGGTFTGSSNQLSAFSFRVDIVNHRDPRDKRFDSLWTKLQHGVAQDLAQSLYQVYDQVLASPSFNAQFQQWLNATVPAIAAAMRANNDAALAQAINQRFQLFPRAPDVIGSNTVLRGFANATTAMLTARGKILDYVGKAPIVTFEYVGNRASPVVAPQMKLPNTSTFRLVAELAPFGGGSFTTNVAATIFNSKPRVLVTNLLRDLQFSSQLDIPANTSVPRIGNVVLSFSVKYQRVVRDVMSMISTTTTTPAMDAALKGDIAIGQAKLTIPVKNTGVKIPVSLTVANRTELIKEREIRGNVGITLDLDTIISKLKE